MKNEKAIEKEMKEKILEALENRSQDVVTKSRPMMRFSELRFELVPKGLIKVGAGFNASMIDRLILRATNSLLKEGKVILRLASTEEVEFKISGGIDWCGSSEFAISLPQTDKPRED